MSPDYFCWRDMSEWLEYMAARDIQEANEARQRKLSLAEAEFSAAELVMMNERYVQQVPQAVCTA